MKPPRKITFVADEFAEGLPAQQFLDRFLIGYPRDGAFHRPDHRGVCLCVKPGANRPAQDRRAKEFGLLLEPDLRAALAGADAIVVVSAGPVAKSRPALMPRAGVGPTPGAAPFASQSARESSGQAGVAAAEDGRPPALQTILEIAQAGAAVFVYGALGNSLSEARALLELASARQLSLAAGSPVSVTWRLPDTDLRPGTRLRAGLIVVQGSFPQAELDALHGLWPVIERRHGGETGVSQVRHLEGAEVWTVVGPGHWSWPLLAAALSRSDSPQGDTVLDGRNQDLIGLGLVPKLARQPRAWLLEHADGLHTAILVLDGVVADINFAVQTGVGQILSAQLYLPPAPGQHQFSRLAALVEDFFLTGRPPWSIQRSLHAAHLLGIFAAQRSTDSR